MVPTSWLGNVSDVGESVAPGATPVPVKLAVCGLPLALSVTVKVPVRVPVAAGANVTLIVHLLPAASELPQLLVWAKSPLSAPVMAMLLIESAALPEFERVTA